MKQDYLSYKRKKQVEMPEIQRPTGKRKKVIALGVLVFVLSFIFVIILSAHFGSRVDIEYGKMGSNEDNYELNDDSVVSGETDSKYTIDSRLKALQIAETTRQNKIDNKPNEIEEVPETSGNEIAKIEDKSIKTETQTENKVAYSKVLLGRYSSFEEAKVAQAKLRQTAGIEAFIRKMGNVYALQVGSYLNPNQAKQVATRFSNMEYQVWILED